MKKFILSTLCILILVFSSIINAEDTKSVKKTDKLNGTSEGVIADVLMTDKLDLAEGTEVVVSYVSMPANTELPFHWHHGEEFIYVLEGSAVIIQKDKSDTTLKKGDVFKISLKQIHSAKTTNEAVSVIVFRVHEEGQPVRVNVK